MNRRWLIATDAGAALLVVANETVFVVDEGRQAVVASFGRAMRVINPPGARQAGPQIKLPFVQQVVVLDRREMALETPVENVTSADGQPLQVGALVAWRITDPLAFWRVLGDEPTAADRLGRLADAALARALAPANAADIAGRRPDLAATALVDLRARAAGERLGVEVTDLAIRYVGLPPAGVEAADTRMRIAFQQKAGQIRAQGEARRHEIMSEADKQSVETLAKADEQAAAVRGAGEAQAAGLYAAAYGKDPDFARFYRTMRAYEEALAQPSVTLVISPDSDFFRFLKLGAKAK
jgi:modulator of FtsH protease HflC